MRVRVQGLNKLPPSLKSAAVLANQSEQEETSCATRDRGQRATVRRVPSAKRTLGVQHQLGVLGDTKSKELVEMFVNDFRKFLVSKCRNYVSLRFAIYRWETCGFIGLGRQFKYYFYC